MKKKFLFIISLMFIICLTACQKTSKEAISTNTTENIEFTESKIILDTLTFIEIEENNSSKLKESSTSSSEEEIVVPPEDLKEEPNLPIPFEDLMFISLENSMIENTIRIKGILEIHSKVNLYGKHSIGTTLNGNTYNISLPKEVFELLDNIPLQIDMVLLKTETENSYEFVNFRFLDYEEKEINSLDKAYLLNQVEILKAESKDLIKTTIGLVKEIEDDLIETTTEKGTLYFKNLEDFDIRTINLGETYVFEYYAVEEKGFFNKYYNLALKPVVSDLKIYERKDNIEENTALENLNKTSFNDFLNSNYIVDNVRVSMTSSYGEEYEMSFYNNKTNKNYENIKVAKSVFDFIKKYSDFYSIKIILEETNSGYNFINFRFLDYNENIIDLTEEAMIKSLKNDEILIEENVEKIFTVTDAFIISFGFDCLSEDGETIEMNLENNDLEYKIQENKKYKFSYDVYNINDEKEYIITDLEILD